MTSSVNVGLHSNLLESTYSLKESLQIAGEVGYDGYEIDIGAYAGTILQGSTQEWTGVRSPDDLLGEMGQMATNWATAAGIELNSVCLGMLWKYNLAARREAEVEKAVAATKDAIRAAAVLGADVILLPMWTPDGVSASEARQNVVAAITEPLALAEHHDVTLALENIPQTSDIVAGSEDLVELIDAIDSDYCGLYYDVANARMAGFNPAEEIRSVGADRIAQMHFKDADLDTNDTVAVTAGDLDFEAIRDALDDIDYSGYVTIESGSGFIESSDRSRAREIAAENIEALQSLGLRDS